MSEKLSENLSENTSENMTENSPENLSENSSQNNSEVMPGGISQSASELVEAPEEVINETSEVFVVRNQLGHYWGKSKAWVDGTEPKAIMRAKHQDEAINTLFELSSGDVELRGEVLGVALSDRGEVVVEPSEHLLPKEDTLEPELTAEETDGAIAAACAAGETEQPKPSGAEGLN